MKYNRKLSGKPGLEERSLNLHKRVTHEVLVRKPMTPGDNLYLTIDSTLQYYVEKALLKGLKNNATKSVSAILIHAKTGEILALSTIPSFNPNARRDFNAKKQIGQRFRLAEDYAFKAPFHARMRVSGEKRARQNSVDSATSGAVFWNRRT